MENEGEGARCQDSSVCDSEHIEGTNAKHGAITNGQDDKTLSEHDNLVETEQAVNAKVCNNFNLHKSLYGKVSEKRDLACIIKKHNKIALRLKCYNFRRVNAIVFLFSALHTTPFLYGKIHFGILNMLMPVSRCPIPQGVQTRHNFL